MILQNKVMVFVPAYNCAPQIPRVMAQITDEVLNCVSEIVVVNNRSTDDTENIAVNFAKEHENFPLTVLRNDENYSLGGSHKVAFQYAKKAGYDYVVVLHGDDQAKIKDLLGILKSGEYQNYDALLGARFIEGAKLEGYSLLRTVSNQFFNALYTLTTGRRIYDLGSGLNMFSVNKITEDIYLKLPDSLGFNNCLLLSMCANKINIKFFPINWSEEDQVSNLKLWRFGLFNLSILWQYFRSPMGFANSEMRSKIIDDYSSQVVYTNKK